MNCPKRDGWELITTDVRIVQLTHIPPGGPREQYWVIYPETPRGRARALAAACDWSADDRLAFGQTEAEAMYAQIEESADDA